MIGYAVKLSLVQHLRQKLTWLVFFLRVTHVHIILRAVLQSHPISVFL